MKTINKNEKMPSFPRDALEQAKTVRSGWLEVGDQLAVPNLTMDKFLTKLAQVQDMVSHAEKLKQERAQAIHERNICLSELWDLTKRIRHAAKATFGDNSNELELLVNFQRTTEYQL